jgi:transcriptional regulator with XRE-family HTH domain
VSVKSDLDRDEAAKGKPGVGGVGERLKSARELRHMTQADLATKTGLKECAISHFECGRRLPCVRNLRALSIALNTSADYLLDSNV